MTAKAFPIRMWQYQAERFPLAKTGFLTGAFSSASVTASAILAGRALPGWETYLVAFLCAFCVMFQLRVLDEHKDNEDDTRYRPERPVPRGLVTLRELDVVGAASVLLPLACLYALDWRLPLIYVGVLAFMGLMTVHFFVPQSTVLPKGFELQGSDALLLAVRADLKGNAVFTLLSHMMIMPLLDLLVTATEWLPTGNGPPPGLWIFLCLSFANGCVVEIGRKVWAPESERVGVDTYSARWTYKGAATALMTAVMASFLFLTVLSMQLGKPSLAVAGLLLVALVGMSLLTFVAKPDRMSQLRVEVVSGIYVFACYMCAGFLPLIDDWLLS